jgi:uncharacterized membrane protein YedE/YeeE
MRPEEAAMSIVNFTPLSALIGGALIGLAAALLWWMLGRIAGVSNVLGSVVAEPGGDNAWRIAFLAGLLFTGLGAVLLFPGAVHFDLKAGAGQLLIAGLLVGFGTQLGGGCTSGHGVCGIGRLSVRSVVATLCFMASGMLTVFVVERLS